MLNAAAAAAALVRNYFWTMTERKRVYECLRRHLHRVPAAAAAAAAVGSIYNTEQVTPNSKQFTTCRGGATSLLLGCADDDDAFDKKSQQNEPTYRAPSPTTQLVSTSYWTQHARSCWL